MAQKIISSTTLTDWANAIREKEASTGAIMVSNMAQRILGIAGGGEFIGGAIETGTVTAAESMTIPHSLGRIQGAVLFGASNDNALLFIEIIDHMIGGVIGGDYTGTLTPEDSYITVNDTNVATIKTDVTSDSILKYSYILIGG